MPNARPSSDDADPTDDVISDILAPTIDGDRLTEREFKNFFVLLVSAGNDTTRYTMAAGMKALIERPDQLAELRDSVIAGETALMESAVEEILRWGTVTMHFRRTATADITMHDRQIKRGDKVVIWFNSADFDDRQFPDPYTLRHPPHAQRPRCLRPDEPAPVPRCSTGTDGAEGRLRGTASADQRRPRRTDRSNDCARTSSAASSGCRSR